MRDVTVPVQEAARPGGERPAGRWHMPGLDPMRALAIGWVMPHRGRITAQLPDPDCRTDQFRTLDRHLAYRSPR